MALHNSKRRFDMDKNFPPLMDGSLVCAGFAMFACLMLTVLDWAPLCDRTTMSRLPPDWY